MIIINQCLILIIALNASIFLPFLEAFENLNSELLASKQRSYHNLCSSYKSNRRKNNLINSNFDLICSQSKKYNLRGGGGDDNEVRTEQSDKLDDRIDFGSEKIQDIIEKLSTDIRIGLTSNVASKRLATYGENILISPPGKSLLKLIAEQFEDRLVQILLCVAALSGVFSYFEMQQHEAIGLTKSSILQSFAEPLIILSILGESLCHL